MNQEQFLMDCLNKGDISTFFQKIEEWGIVSSFDVYTFNKLKGEITFSGVTRPEDIQRLKMLANGLKYNPSMIVSAPPVAQKPDEEKPTPTSTTITNMEKFDYAIINALYEDELKFIETFVIEEGRINDNQKVILYGRLKNRPDKKVIYTILPETGMVDAAIVTTDIITRYKPEYVFMTGVCGGSEKTELGDVVIANKVFVFQKGKETDTGFKRESLEVEIDIPARQNIERAISKILHKMEDDNIAPFKVYINPMACSMSVIDKEGFFEETLTTTDRKTMALEMESYGVARACKLANEGKTKAIIMKGVMDKTSGKDDSFKKKAGKNSATFLRYLLEGNYL